MNSFAELLDSLLNDRKLTQSAFAEKTGSSQQGISQVLSGQRNPPKQPATLKRWADVLDLDKGEQEEFFSMADFSRAPESVQTRILRLTQENEELRSELQRVTNEFHNFKDLGGSTTRKLPGR